MKKLIVLSFFIVFSLILNGQITINSTDFATVGSVFYQSTDTTHFQFDVGGTGQQTWELSNIPIGNIDTFKVIDPNTSPNIENYPDCNLVLKIIGFDSSVIYQYMQIDTSLNIYGIQMTSTNLDSMYQNFYPFQYRNSFPMIYSNASKTIYNYIEISKMNFSDNNGLYMKISNLSDTISIDAWGNLNLPNFQNLNTLRTSIHIKTIDTLFYISELGDTSLVNSSSSYSHEYLWFTNDPRMRFRALQVNINSNDTSIQYINYASVITKLISTNKNEIEIFPNPAKEQIQIKYIPQECSSIDFINILGEKVKHIKKTNFEKEISVNNLSAGIYIIKFNSTQFDEKLLIKP